MSFSGDVGSRSLASFYSGRLGKGDPTMSEIMSWEWGGPVEETLRPRRRKSRDEDDSERGVEDGIMMLLNGLRMSVSQRERDTKRVRGEQSVPPRCFFGLSFRCRLQPTT